MNKIWKKFRKHTSLHLNLLNTNRINKIMNKFSDSLGLMIFISHDKFFRLDACNSQIKHIELFAVRIFSKQTLSQR